MLQKSKLRDLKAKDANLCELARGELKRSLQHDRLPTELHMIQCAKKRAGLSYEVTNNNINQKLQ